MWQDSSFKRKTCGAPFLCKRRRRSGKNWASYKYFFLFWMCARKIKESSSQLDNLYPTVYFTAARRDSHCTVPEKPSSSSVFTFLLSSFEFECTWWRRERVEREIVWCTARYAFSLSTFATTTKACCLKHRKKQWYIVASSILLSHILSLSKGTFFCRALSFYLLALGESLLAHYIWKHNAEDPSTKMYMLSLEKRIGQFCPPYLGQERCVGRTLARKKWGTLNVLLQLCEHKKLM